MNIDCKTNENGNQSTFCFPLWLRNIKHYIIVLLISWISYSKIQRVISNCYYNLYYQHSFLQVVTSGYLGTVVFLRVFFVCSCYLCFTCVFYVCFLRVFFTCVFKLCRCSKFFQSARIASPWLNKFSPNPLFGIPSHLAISSQVLKVPPS